MRIRRPGPADEPPEDDESWEDTSTDGEPWNDAEPSGDFDAPRRDEVGFAVPTSIMVVKFALAAVLAVVAIFSGDAKQLVIGLVAALAVGVYAARDVIARERLRADGEGIVTVRGYAGHRRIAWSDVERVRVWRPSVGLRAATGSVSDTLEIDAGEEIFLFRRYDLGVDPPEALAALDEVRGVKPE